MNISMGMHCPYCDETRVAGLGLVLLSGAPLVQYRCERCGELFFVSDRRTEKPAQPPDL